MAQGRIKWKHGDYISLGRAVAQFNKKINQLKTEENKLYLPEEIDFKEARENIVTRSELNRLINSLRRFSKEGAEDLYVTESGEQLTKWERRELGIQSRIVQTRLRAELKQLEKPLEDGISRIQMGSQRAKEIEAQIKNLKQIETKKGYEFKQLKERLGKLGTSDYIMKKAIVYRENYINEMKKYSHFDNYDKFMKKLESISNPIEFFNFVSKNELMQDLTYQSDEYYTQEAFNNFIQDFGVEIDEDSISLEKPIYKYTLISTLGNEISHSNNRNELVILANRSKDMTIKNGWIRLNY